MLEWLPFGASACGVIGAGILIGQISGEIGERLRLGRAWAGAVLLSLATTLPELVATVTVTLHGQVGLAVGGILGSIIFNLLILVFVDLFGRESIYPRVSITHLATGLLGCALLGLLMVGMTRGDAGVGGSFNLGIGHVGIISLLMLGCYGGGQYVLFRMARRSYHAEPKAQETRWTRVPTRRVCLIYAVLIGVTVVSAYHLGVSAEHLTARYGFGATFAGATLLGIVTSLPELTNGLTCARQREFDLVVGNVLGANVFVFVVLVIADFCYLRGPLVLMLTSADTRSSMAMAGLAIIMQGIVLAAIAFRSAAKIWRISLVSVLLAVLYVTSLVLTYRVSGT